MADNAQGSGFFVRIRGRVFFMTNHHVVENVLVQEGPGRTRQIKPIHVRTPNGTVTRANVWKSSRGHDIAILRLESVPPATDPLDLSSELPAPGAGVFVWGAPYGEALVPLDGSVESVDVNRDAELFAGSTVRVIRVRISVGPGNSGGPLLDHAGNVIGVVTARQETSDRFSTGRAIAVATSVFHGALLGFDPGEGEPSGSVPRPSTEHPRLQDALPRVAPPLQPGPRDAEPPRVVPPSGPGFARNDFELGELQAHGVRCLARLILPPAASVFRFSAPVRPDSHFAHFPTDFVRMLWIRHLGPATVEVATLPSRDGGPTFICVLG